MAYKLYSNITCPNPTEGSTENITKTCTQRKTLHALIYSFNLLIY